MRKRNSLCSKKNRGFTLTLDAAFALFLTISALVLASRLLVESPIEESISKIGNTLEQALAVMEAKGFLAETLVDQNFPAQPVAKQLYEETTRLLPKNMEIKITVTQYDLNKTACQATRTFESCFPPALRTVQEYGPAIPEAKNVIRKRKVFAKRQPIIKGADSNQCIIEAELAAEPLLENIKNKKVVFEEKTVPEKIFFQRTLPQIDTNVVVVPSDRLFCDQNASVKLMARALNRDPVAIDLVNDRSGSMWDFDMNKGRIGSGRLDSGTCDNRSCDPESTGACQNHTNWQPIGTINTTGLFDSSDRIGYVVVQITYSGYDGNCSRPRFRASYSNGTETRYRKSNSTSPVELVVGKGDIVSGGTISLFGWSDESIDYSLIQETFEGREWEKISSNTFNEGIADVDLIGVCINHSNWHTLGTISLTDINTTKVDVNMSYTGYDGNCTVRMRVVDSNGSTYERNCGAGASGACSTSSSYSDSALVPGTWTVLGWSDENITASVDYNYNYYRQIDNQFLGTSSVSNGTPVERNIVSAQCNTFSSWQRIGNFNVTATNILRVRSRMDFSGYDGNCNAQLRLVAPDLSTFSIVCRGYSDFCEVESSTYSGNIPQGNWIMEGWSDVVIDANTFHKFIYATEETPYSLDFSGTFNAGITNFETDRVVLDYLNWQLVGSFNDSNGTLAWVLPGLTYTGYTGSEGPRIKLVEPGTIIPDNFLVGWWRFDEGTGTAAADSSGSANNGALENMEEADWVSGVFNTSLNFDGINDNVMVSHSASLSPPYLTMSSWIRPRATGRDYRIIINKESDYQWAWNSSTNIQWAIDTPSRPWFWVDSGVQAPVDDWAFLELTYDGHYVEVYKNKSLDHSFEYDFDTLSQDAMPLRIGDRELGPSPFPGKIDEPKVYSADIKKEAEKFCGTAASGSCLLQKYYSPHNTYYPGVSPNGTYNIYVWSDRSITANTYLSRRVNFNSGNINLVTGRNFNDGNADRNYTALCTRLDNFRQLTTFTVTDSSIERVQVKMDYADYNGLCTVQLRLVDPNDSNYTVPCGKTFRDSCIAFSNNYTGNIPTGTWKVFGWSNDVIDANIFKRHEWNYFTLPGGSVSSGTCSGRQCSRMNCSPKTNWVVLSPVSLPANSKAELVLDYSDYNGVCQPAVSGRGTSTVEGQCFSLSATTGKCVLSIGNNGVTSEEISVEAWSDENMDYSARIDTARHKSSGTADINLAVFFHNSPTSMDDWNYYYNYFGRYGLDSAAAGSTTAQDIYDASPSGNNPFGADVNYSKEYLGHIYAGSPGYYRLAVDADDAGTIFVDGGETANRYGRNPSLCNCWNNNALVWLNEGYHSLEAYMGQTSGTDAVRAGWKEPFQNTVARIPQRAFDRNALSVSGGTATGSGASCSSFGNWVQVDSFSITETNVTKVFGQAVFPKYRGRCSTPGAKLVAPNAAEYVTANNCSIRNGQFFCTVKQSFTPPAYAPTGTWRLFAWSDSSETAYPSIHYWLSTSLSGRFDEGTCNGLTCTAGAAACQNFTNWQPLGGFNVNDHMIGARVTVGAMNYNGACTSARARLKDPAGIIVREKPCTGTCQLEVRNFGIAYLPMDEIISGKVIDHAGYSNDLSVSGAVLSGGAYGNALSFDGIDDVASVPDNATLDISGNITVSAWVKKRDASVPYPFPTIVGKSTAGEDIAYMINYDSAADNIGFTIGNNNGVYDLVSVPAPSVGVWYHVVGVADVSNVMIYLGGVLAGSAPRTVTAMGNTSTPLCIGSAIFDRGDTCNTALGVLDIDDVKIFDRALSSGEISELYNAANPAIPLRQGRWNVEVWADRPTDFNSNYFITRIDALKEVTKNFIDTAQWKSDDKLGAASFSYSARVDQNLTTNKPLVKTSLNKLLPAGATGIGFGIFTGTGQLVTADTNRFMILMSDGLANVPPPNPNQYALDAARNAKDNNITIYTIAFGTDADQSLLRQIAELTGGRSYTAFDINALRQVYDLILQHIQKPVEGVRIIIPVPLGHEVSDYNTGVWNANARTLTFTATLPSITWWEQTYKLDAPCDGPNCDNNTIAFPSYGTFFRLRDGTEIDWNKHVVLPFKFSDLTVKFLGGRIISPTSVDTNSEVINTGYRDISAAGGVDVKFYRDRPREPANLLVQRNTAKTLFCSYLETPGCSLANATEFIQQQLAAKGFLYVTINESRNARECPLHNEAKLVCVGDSQVKYYVVDYWVWNK